MRQITHKQAKRMGVKNSWFKAKVSEGRISQHHSKAISVWCQKQNGTGRFFIQQGRGVVNIEHANDLSHFSLLFDLDDALDLLSCTPEDASHDPTWL